MPREVKSSGGAWTDAERYKFLIQVIAQLESSGKKVDLGKIAATMPGRTAKSLSHMMVKIRAEAAAFDTDSTNAASAAPSAAGRVRGQKMSSGAASSGRKRKVSNKTTDNGDEDSSTEEDASPTKKAMLKESAASREIESHDVAQEHHYPIIHVEEEICDGDSSICEA